MADPLILNPTLTLAGQAAAFNAANTGIELILDAVSFGRAHYNPTGNELALADPVGSHVPFAGGSRPTLYQLRISAAWDEDVGEVGIGEIGFWSGDVLVFVWSLANGTVASYKTDGVAYVLMADLGFAQVPAGSINLVIDSNVDAALAALSAHEGAANAHPQYLLRADVAKDVGPLMGLVHSAGSAANALLLKLDAPESKLPALAKFQRFQFVAAATNTGPVTVNIAGLGVKAVKRGGDTGLIELDAGDIKAGSLYDLNYDGASFQLGGGVGSGKAFARYSFIASVAQTIFVAPHVPGCTVVLRNGREVTGYASAADGSKITMTVPCNVNDSIEILAFKSFKVADSYTKSEMLALLSTASGMPVGAMLPVPKNVVPPGYLEVDGSVQSIAAYPDLAAYLGTAFNKGNEGAGNFRLPDSRGEFLRGWDHGRGVDAGRTVGSAQDGSLLRSVASNGAAAGAGNMWGNTEFDNLGGGVFYSTVTSNSTTSYQQGTVRPRNLAVMWCIKAWNAPINQGQIDIAALAALAAQASEANQGTAKIATLDQVIAGTSDSLIVSPKKLRWGFAASFGVNGYIALPNWLGGLILQWGVDTTVDPTGSKAMSYPMAFPNAVFIVSVSDRASSISTLNVVGADEGTKTGFNVWSASISSGGVGAAQGSLFKWFAIGN